MVNAQVLQGQWNQIRGELKKKWGQLTEDDLRSLDEAVPRTGWAGDRRSFAAVGTSRRTGPVPGQACGGTARPRQRGK